MLNFISACGFESSVRSERANHDAYIYDYKDMVISIRCIQSTKDSKGGWVSWIWSKDSGKLTSEYKMVGIAPHAEDFPIILSESKKVIDAFKSEL